MMRPLLISDDRHVARFVLLRKDTQRYFKEYLRSLQDIYREDRKFYLMQLTDDLEIERSILEKNAYHCKKELQSKFEEILLNLDDRTDESSDKAESDIKDLNIMFADYKEFCLRLEWINYLLTNVCQNGEMENERSYIEPSN